MEIIYNGEKWLWLNGSELLLKYHKEYSVLIKKEGHIKRVTVKDLEKASAN